MIRAYSITRIGRAHHGLARFPLNSLFDDISRCPAGGYIELSENTDITPGNYLFNYFEDEKILPEKKLSVKFFEEKLKLIMMAYKSHYGEISLFMSGGIDSSVLLAIAVKNNIPVNCHYIPYTGIKDNNCKIAEYITSSFGLKLNIVEKDSLNESQFRDVLILRAKSGPASLLKTNYINWYQKKDISPRVGITGQNLDSMYHIDTYAPNTEYTGIYRLLVLLKSSYHRMKYTSINVIYMNILSKINKKNRVISKMFEKTLNSDDEHVKKGQVTSDIPYYEAKILETEKFKKFINLSELPSLTIAEQNKFYKMIKFFRFVQNTYSNYFVLKKTEDLTRVNPFGEGPFLYGLINYKLPIKSTLRIKFISHQVFKNISGSHHNELVRRAVGYTFFKDIKRILRYFYSLSFEKKSITAPINFSDEAKKMYMILKKEISLDENNLEEGDRVYVRTIIERITNQNFIGEKDYDEILKVIGTLVYLTDCYKKDYT